MTALPLTPTATARDGGRLLRLALRWDAVASGGLGFLAVAAAPVLDGALGPPATVLRSTGAFLVAYALALVLLAARRAIPRPAAWVVVLGNAAWVLGSVGAVVAGRDSLTALGVGVVLAQAVAVAGFAGVQWLGLRRAG